MNKWDLGKFINTLSYFDVIPVLGDLRRFFMQEEQLNSGDIFSKQLGKDMSKKVLFIGEDRSMKDCPYEVIYAENMDDIIQTYPPLWAIIYVGNDQRAIDEAHLINLAHRFLLTSSNKLVFDFLNHSAELAQLWGSVDDVVMGGVSNSMVKIASQSMVFSGNVSTENSGGFASIRTKNFNPTLDWNDYQGITLKVKGDGKRYKLILRCENSWDGIGYTASFDTISNQWIDVKIPFDQLVPVFRAKTVNNAPAIDLNHIYAIQIMLSKFEYDGRLNPNFQIGMFNLDLESIAVYGQLTHVQFIIVDAHSPSDRYNYLINSLNELKISSRIISNPEQWPSLILN
jgi:hypothetical protein